MRKNEALPSKYLNAADVGSGIYKLTIRSVVMEKMENDGAMKPVMSFVKAQKSMPINATNWDNMASTYGDESDDWIGKQIEMYTEATRMPNGTPTRGVRIRPVAGPDTAAAMQEGQALGQAPINSPSDNGQGVEPGESAAAVGQSLPADLDDEIPF